MVFIPIAIRLCFMMYPIMVKIDFSEVITAGKSGKLVFLTLFVYWCVKPFTMHAFLPYFFWDTFLRFYRPGCQEKFDIIATMW